MINLPSAAVNETSPTRLTGKLAIFEYQPAAGEGHYRVTLKFKPFPNRIIHLGVHILPGNRKPAPGIINYNIGVAAYGDSPLFGRAAEYLGNVERADFNRLLKRIKP